MYTCSLDKQEFPTRHDLNEHRRRVHFLRIKGRFRNRPDPKLVEFYSKAGIQRHDTVDAVFFVQEHDGTNLYEVCVSIKHAIFSLDRLFNTEDEAVTAMKQIRGE